MNNGRRPQPFAEIPINASTEYLIPETTAEAEIEIKKSRFIARACHSADRDQAMAHLAQARRDYPDARHHCWAYLFGPPRSPTGAAMSDDGEPGGTAGKPILNVLQHKDVGDIMVIVIRYFGGIKLGAGGLVRAYGQAAQAAIDALTLETRIPTAHLTVRCDFAQEQSVRHWLTQHGGRIESQTYQELVSLGITLPQRSLPDWRAYAEGQGIDTGSE